MKRLLRSTALALALAFFLPLPGPVTGIVFDPAAYADPVTGQIPDWIKAACCGVADLHKLRADQVREREDGRWDVDGYPWPVSEPVTQIDISRDQNVYAFYCEPDTAGAACTKGQFSTMWCLFIEATN